MSQKMATLAKENVRVNGGERKGGIRKLHSRNIVVSDLHQKLLGDQTKEDDMA
jgi:hypothetical protein